MNEQQKNGAPRFPRPGEKVPIEAETVQVKVREGAPPQLGVNVGDPEIISRRTPDTMHLGTNPLREGLLVLLGSVAFSLLFLALFYGLLGRQGPKGASPEVRAAYESLAFMDEAEIRRRANRSIDLSALEGANQQTYAGSYLVFSAPITRRGTVVYDGTSLPQWDEPVVNYLILGDAHRVVVPLLSRFLSPDDRPERLEVGDRILLFGLVPTKRVYQSYSAPIKRAIAQQLEVKEEDLILIYPRLILSYDQ